MKIFRSAEFSILLQDLERYQHQMEDEKRYSQIGIGEPLAKQLLPQITGELKQAQKLCEDVGLEGAAENLALTCTHLEHHWVEVDHSSLRADLRKVADMIMVDFWKRRFVQVDPRLSSFLENDKLFGETVSRAFPSAVFDIREAGNCVAVDLGTASVFHLMRVVECGLRALCASLGINRIRRSHKPNAQKYVPLAWAQWELMLNNAESKANKQMDKLGPGKRKQSLQEFYIPIFQYIRGFKDAFRNHIMHGRKSFTGKEAEAIGDNVDRFMSLLSTRISE